jgi:hypothetical protein
MISAGFGTDAAGNRTRAAIKKTIREASFVASPPTSTARTRNASAPRSLRAATSASYGDD